MRSINLSQRLLSGISFNTTDSSALLPPIPAPSQHRPVSEHRGRDPRLFSPHTALAGSAAAVPSPRELSRVELCLRFDKRALGHVGGAAGIGWSSPPRMMQGWHPRLLANTAVHVKSFASVSSTEGSVENSYPRDKPCTRTILSPGPHEASDPQPAPTAGSAASEVSSLEPCPDPPSASGRYHSRVTKKVAERFRLCPLRLSKGEIKGKSRALFRRGAARKVSGGEPGGTGRFSRPPAHL